MIKKRLMSLTICFLLLSGSVIGCGSSGTADKAESSAPSKVEAVKEKESEVSTTEAAETTAEETTVEESTEEETTAKSEDVNIEEQVIYDDNGILVKATGIEDSTFGTDLTLYIENNSDKDITIQSRDTNINGFMVEALMSTDVAAGKKSNSSLTFESNSLKKCGINQIAHIETKLYIIEADTWAEIDTSDVITIDTSVAEGFEQPVDDSGDILVDENGIKIINKGLSKDSSFLGPEILLYIENDYDSDIVVQVRDVSVNGFMVDAMMSEEVLIGKKSFSAVTFLSSDLEKNGIKDIEEVELYFTIINNNTYETIYDSDIFTLKF